MEDLRAKIDDLATLIDDFKLAEANLHGEGWRVAFKKRATRHVAVAEHHEEQVETEVERVPATEPVEEKPSGTPVTSPMNGIYYSSPSPSAPPFVKVGDNVTAGQVVGLIEAMKVFNEIVAPMSGSVVKVVAETGQLVLPGEPLLYIG